MYKEEIIQKYMVNIMKEYPNHIAIECEGEQICYKELHHVSDKIACELKAANIGKQAHIGVYMGNKVNIIYAMLGIMKAGCVFVPLEEEYTINRVIHMIHAADVQLVLYDKAKSEIQDEVDSRVKTLSIEEMLRGGYSESLSIDEGTYQPDDKLYIYFTSGTTGNPNAVVGENKSLLHFILWEIHELNIGAGTRVSQLTSSSHDPYLRDVLVPLLSGGTVCIPSHNSHVLTNNLAEWMNQARIQILHCTPSLFHILNSFILTSEDFKELKYVLLAGEKVKPWSLKYWYDIFDERIQLINLYGPTETTLAKLFYYIHKEDCKKDEIPIGKPIEGCKVVLIDEGGNITDNGEIYIKTPYMTKGYYKNDELNRACFVQNPFIKEEDIIYKTGDFGKLLPDGNIVFKGRKDKQIKIRGNRVEVDEIEKKMQSFPGIKDCVVDYDAFKTASKNKESCTRCGIPANFPNVEIDSEGICNLCRLYENNNTKINQYFKTPADFENIFANKKESQGEEYDCLLLYSGGKDSTYVLSKLLNMGLNVLAYFFDNGYTSDQAYQNIIHSFEEFKVDYVIDKQDNMNDIFLSGIKKECSVCNGCFKVLSYRSLKLAFDKGIKYIVTGFSRGQIFDLRLESIYRQNCFDLEEVEKTIEEHRLVYFCKPDYVTENMDEAYKVTEEMLKSVTFLDFYRYHDISREDIYNYLKKECSFWAMPEDTGKCSSNCLINDVGIYLQQRMHGYDNYTSKDCWEVRLLSSQQKTAFRYDDIDIAKVNTILKKIGYEGNYLNIPYENQVLKGYYVSDEEIDEEELKKYLKEELQDYMIPTEIVRLEEIPLTQNKKIDYTKLASKKKKTTVVTKPRNQIEARIIEIWKDIINIDNINVTDSFMDIGGNSLNVLNLISQIYNEFEVELDLSDLFHESTVEAIAHHIEQASTASR
jgi:amino acid adenylation domain-containing protein